MLHKHAFNIRNLKSYLREYSHPERRAYIKVFKIKDKDEIERQKDNIIQIKHEIIRNLYSYAPFQKMNFGTKVHIKALCSIIHIPSIIAINHMRDNLSKYGIDIEIIYFTNSSEALLEIEKSNKTPIIVTVTKGTADKLDAEFGKYECQKAVESIPGILTWSSPCKLYDWKNIRDIRFHTFQHPTDIIAQDKFVEFLKHPKIEKQLKIDAEDVTSKLFEPLYDMPEEEEYYNNLKPNQLTLSVDLLDRLALKKYKSEKYTFPYWTFVERRYLYFNEALVKENDEKKIFVKFIQNYLYDALNFMIYEPYKFHSKNTLLKEYNFIQAIKTYLKKQ